jgi:hypothetical protein
LPNPSKGSGPTRLAPLIGFLWSSRLRGGLRTHACPEVSTCPGARSSSSPSATRRGGDVLLDGRRRAPRGWGRGRYGAARGGSVSGSAPSSATRSRR